MATIYNMDVARALWWRHIDKEGTRMQQERPPVFIEPISIAEMNDEQIDELLEGMRMRRMASKAIYDETTAVRALAKKHNLEGNLTKKLDRFAVQYKKACDALDKAEGLANEVRQLRMAIEQVSVA